MRFWFVETFLLAAAVFLGVQPITAPAEPILRAGVTSYYVGGASVDAIRKDIEANAPPNLEGAHVASFTKWELQWRWKTEEKDGQCGMAQATAVLGVSMFVPKLRNQAAATASLLARWKKYEKALRAHEEGHMQIATRAAREIEATLLKMQPESTCAALQLRADEIAKGMLENYRKEDAIYAATAEQIKL